MKTSDTALKIVKQFEKIAPGIYKDSELTPDGKVALSMKAVSKLSDWCEYREAIISTTNLARTAFLWRMYKQQYQFDPDLEEMLLNQEPLSETKMPVAALKSLPYPAIFIQTSVLKDEGLKIDGFFAALLDEWGKEQLVLSTVPKGGELIQSVSIQLDDSMTVNEAVDECIKIRSEISDRYGWHKPEYLEGSKEIVNQMLQLVLYICAQNAEKELNPEHKKIHRDINPKKIRDQFKEIQSWDIGEKTGAIIRTLKTRGTNNRTGGNYSHSGSHRPKRTHIRKGHYHHFWRGPRNSEERKLVVNWVAPTIINGNLVEDVEIPETVTIVK